MSEVENPQGLDLRPLLTRPKKVAIVALGFTAQHFIQEVMSNPTMKAPFDEVWTLNRGLRGFAHDKLFCMDDFRWLEKRNEAYANFLKEHDKPIITSTVYDDYPMALPYPLHEVIEFWEDDICTVNTVAYAVGYAGYIGVEELSIYGADFCYPNGNQAERGGQAVAYLLGAAAHKTGMKHRIPAGSTLLHSDKIVNDGGAARRVYYGYHRRDEMKAEEAKKQKGKRKK